MIKKLKCWKKVKTLIKIIINQTFKVCLVMILENVSNISNTWKKIIIQILKKLEIFCKIAIKHILKMRLWVISKNVSNIFNTWMTKIFKYYKY